MARGMRVLLAIGWIATLIVLLWEVRRITSGDLAVILGVLVIWAVDLGTALCYFLLVVRPCQDPELATWQLQSFAQEFRGAAIVGLLLVPGVWVGLAARSPLTTGLVALLIMEALFVFTSALEGGKPGGAPLPITERAAYFCDRTVKLLAAVLAGVALRALLRL